MLQVGVIGIGNCGNQVALLAHKEAGCDAYAINTSDNDLAMLPDDIPRRAIGKGEGSGKNREGAKKYLKGAIMELIAEEEFKDFLANKDVILVVSSAGGGTGSGIAPLLSKIISSTARHADGTPKLVILVGVLPRIAEGYSTQVNALDYTREIYEVLERPTYMIYDNNAYKNEKSAIAVLQKVNMDIVEDIKVIQCRYNNATPYDSIDEADMKTLLSSPGRIAIFRLAGVKEKDLDETTIEDLLIDRIKKSSHTELQRDGIIMRTGVITNLDVRLNEVFDTHIPKIRTFVGEPVEEFLHVSVNDDRALPNNVFLILTGLSKIQDRINKIDDRIEEIDKEQEEKLKALDAASGVSAEDIAKMNEKRQYRASDDSGEAPDLKNIFADFGV